MACDIVGGVKIAIHQGGRHRQGVAGVTEAFTCGTIGRELPGRLQVHTQQITQGVGVAGVVETPQNHSPRVACPLPRQIVEQSGHPAAELLLLDLFGLFGAGGGHLTGVELFGYPAPGAGIETHFAGCSQSLQIEFTLKLGGRMTF